LKKQIQVIEMNNKKIIYLFVGFLIIFVIFFTIKRKIDLDERNQFGVVSVAKIGNFKGSKGGKRVNFVYFVDEKMYKNDCNIDDYPKIRKGEFYKIIYSSKNPKNVEIFLGKRVNDTALINKAGLNYEKKIRDLYR